MSGSFSDAGRIRTVAMTVAQETTAVTTLRGPGQPVDRVPKDEGLQGVADPAREDEGGEEGGDPGECDVAAARLEVGQGQGDREISGEDSQVGGDVGPAEGRRPVAALPARREVGGIQEQPGPCGRRRRERRGGRADA